MSKFSRYALVLPFLTLGVAPAVYAQSSGAGYFMPPTASSHGGAADHARRAEATPAARADDKIPTVPTLPPQPAPPTAVIGVLSVPDVLQNSTAAQGVQAVIQQRQAVLAKEAQAARDKIQAQQQAIMAEHGKESDAVIEKKEQALQNQIAATQTNFQERNEAIQASAQQALQRIEATLVEIVKQEAQAHGMNLILHREQVVLNVAAFDITDETTKELNKLLPHVSVPPSVVTQAIKNSFSEGQNGGANEDGGVGP